MTAGTIRMQILNPIQPHPSQLPSHQRQAATAEEEEEIEVNL